MSTNLYDIETEESVLANILAYRRTYDMVRSSLCDDSFSSQPCKMVWKAIKWSAEQNGGESPDLELLRTILRERKRFTDLDNLERIAKAPTSVGVMKQVELLEDYRQRRIYNDMRLELQSSTDKNCKELAEIVSNAQEQLSKMKTSTVRDKIGVMDYAATVINENIINNGQCSMIQTGFRVIDDAGGLPPETEVIIAAFSSQGKTAFAMTLVDNAMKMGVNCAIYSAEMGMSSIAGRFLNMNGWGVPITMFKTRPLMEQTVIDFNTISQEFIDRPGDIFIDYSSTNNVDDICSSIRVLHREHGVRLVMVDYLQIIALYEEGGGSDQEKLASASRKLQALAKKLNICIMVLSQFSRPNKDQGHQPTEDLIRGSGQIYEACDIAIYIYRPEKWDNETYPAPYQDAMKKGTAMIKIGKYRDGESGRSEIVGFDGMKTLFYEFQDGLYSEDPKKNYPKERTTPIDGNPDMLESIAPPVF